MSHACTVPQPLQEGRLSSDSQGRFRLSPASIHTETTSSVGRVQLARPLHSQLTVQHGSTTFKSHSSCSFNIWFQGNYTEQLRANTFHKWEVESIHKVKPVPQSLDSLRPSPSILRISFTSIRKIFRWFSVGSNWASNKSFAKMQQTKQQKLQISHVLLDKGCWQEHWMLARFNCNFFGSFKAHKSQCHRGLSGRINKY